LTELGNRLKEARETKGLSLDDLQEITKIQKRYLVGIEEGNYEMMPGKFYVRAFIKQYCEAVGLDSEEIFEQYKSNVPTTHHDELPEQLSRVKSRKSLSPGQSKALDMFPKILGVVVVIGIAVLIYVLVTNTMSNSNDANNENEKKSEEIGFNESKEFTEEKETSENKAKDKQNSNANETTETIPVDDETKVEQELAVVSSNGKNTTYELKNTDVFALKLVAKGEAWIGVTNSNGEYLYQGTLKADESQELDMKDETAVIINIGRATDVEVYVNDKKLEYAISPTEVLSQLVTIQFTKAE
jgi:cytoskeletal protein RodZ